MLRDLMRGVCVWQRLRDEPVVCVRIERQLTLQKPIVVATEEEPHE